MPSSPYMILSGLLKISPEGLLKMSEDALTALLASHAEHISARDQAHFVSRVRPTEEDRNTLEAALRSCSLMPLTFQIVLFYQYLIRCSYQDDLPMLEQNLIFELELVRFQEMCHGKVHNSVLKQKLACLLLTFLESAIPPQVQIGLSSDGATRLIQKIHHQLTLKTAMNSTLFEDAYPVLFRRLLPFWAGFRRYVLFAQKPMPSGAPTSAQVTGTVNDSSWLSYPF
ncbi:unnamed protein product, partial [Dicrocoelium dendriticum]